MIESVRGVNCPFCRAALFFTDDQGDYESMKHEHPDAPIFFHPGVDVRGWVASREVTMGGKRMVITRRDVLGNRVHPIPCPACRRVYVARLDIVNLPDVVRYEKSVRPFHPPSPQFPPVDPKWGIVGQPVPDFCADVRATKNPMIRAFVARSLKAAGWDFEELRGLEDEFPFQ